MDLTMIKGLGPARREKLTAVGVKTVGELARRKPVSLADDVDIPQGVLEGFHNQARDLLRLADLEGLGDKALESLVDEGIRSIGELQDHDPTALAESTGLSEDKIRSWQGETARSAEAAQRLAEEAKDAGAIALEGLGNARVVLEEGIADAKVKFEDDVLAQARILPVKARDDVEAMLEDLKGNVVVLREEADTAMVRIEEEIVDGIPIFKEKMQDASRSAAEGAEEVRVRVQEIRDKRVLPEKEQITEKAGEFKAKIKNLFSRD